MIYTKIINAQNETQARKILKEKHKHARLICYKFMEDFRLNKGNYQDRKMKVVYVKNYKKLL